VPASVDDYIAGFPPDVQRVLHQVRAAVRRGAPEAREVISYGVPAVRQRRVLVFFAAFTRHIGFYPPVQGGARLMKAVARYAGEKGNLRFPLDLIERLTAVRAAQDAAAARGGGTNRRRGGGPPRHNG
jgi:uncharacterized protein YdhG (YjbR/CyaY superfamily)